ncbi:MAG: septum formation initiator family protein [Ruminococcaceae bacterium]|nr:septum formation initiator family protein [Oscillospiraceae bacterium]MBD8961602.1 septum formation initiator family protein [Oscillospiraceae bacterium]
MKQRIEVTEMAEKKKRKRSFIVSFCIIALCAYFAISLITIHRNIKETKAEIADVKASYNEQVAENNRIKKRIGGGEIDEYVEKVARDELGYVKPGEHVYYDVSVND